MAPRRGPHLCERDVDHQDLLVPDEEVRGLDVAVRKPGVPEGAYQGEPVVDDLVVDLELRVADLLRPVEELSDEQVLALRRELDDAVRARR